MRRGRRTSILAVSTAAGLVLAGAGSMALSPPEIPAERQCLYQLIEGTSADIDCVHPAWLTEAEREDLKTLTRGYLMGARCSITVKIARAAIEKALAASEHVFTSPAQPAECEIETSRGPLKITGTFSPRVVFKGGLAVEATPGLADIGGVNRYLAWPVVHYINFSERITKTMLLMINAYRAHRGSQSN
jgi:hypothetical protein